MITTTTSELVGLANALATLGDHDGLGLGLYVRVSRLQIAVAEWLTPHVERWNRLVAECSGGADEVLPCNPAGEPNPHWGRWVEESTRMKADRVELDVEPITIEELEGLDPPPKSSVLTPLLRVGLLVEEGA